MQAWLSLRFQLFYISLASFETCQSWIVDSARSSRIICIACFNLSLLHLMVFDAWYSDPGWYLGSLGYNTGVRWRYAIAFLPRIKWVVVYFCSWNVWKSVSVLLFILYRIELVYVAIWFVSVNNLLVLSVCDIVLWFLWRCVIALWILPLIIIFEILHFLIIYKLLAILIQILKLRIWLFEIHIVFIYIEIRRILRSWATSSLWYPIILHNIQFIGWRMALSSSDLILWR